MFQLLSVIIAISCGYMFKKIPIATNRLNLLLSIIIQLILFIMGYQFGNSALNLLNDLLSLSKIVGVFVVTLFVFNIYFINLLLNKKIRLEQQINKSLNLWHYIQSSFKYLFYVIVGIVVGAIVHINLLHIEYAVNLLLLGALFIIGHQLRVQDINLLSALLNKTGIILTILVIISSLLAGIVSAVILSLPLKIGLLLSSGFGWYTLSGILASSIVNQTIGTSAFFIDLFREIIALIFVPLMGRRYMYASVGYCGATALDFTLPVIKETFGEEIVPIAITSGMILSLLVPFLIPLFGQL